MIELVHQPMDTALLLERARRADCGAILLFLGTTREWTGTQHTLFLEYDAYHAMAIGELQRLADTAMDRWEIRQVTIVHRLGRVEVAEASIAIVVSSPHRQAAFEAGEWLIDMVKQQIPIWKRDHDANGTSDWLHPIAKMDTLNKPRLP